jgi:hypothetical protein
MKFVNASPYQRTWLFLSKDGRTLVLNPGETVELDQEVDDPWLVPVPTRSKKHEVKEPTDEVKEPSDA